jgi:hypothetical protein
LRQEGNPDVGIDAASIDDHSETCTPFIPLDDVALVWSPIASEVRFGHTLKPEPPADADASVDSEETQAKPPLRAWTMSCPPTPRPVAGAP